MPRLEPNTKSGIFRVFTPLRQLAASAALIASAMVCQSASADTVIVETQNMGAAQTNQVSFTTVTGSFAGSSGKSTAPGLTPYPGSGFGSYYALSTTYGIPAFKIKPTLGVPGGLYEVWVTHIATSCSTDITMGVSTTGGSGLPATTDGFRSTKGINTWYKIGQLQLNAGVTQPEITFTYQTGALSGSARLLADAIKFNTLPAPTITAQPQSLTRSAGTNVTFSVTATGTAPLRYQWKFNSNDILNATNSTLSLTNIQQSAAGSYSVVVSNSGGNTPSSAATLTVNPASPTFLVQPIASRVQGKGTSASFSASAIGTDPISYQWKFNGSDIPGANGTAYTRSNLTTSDTGTYTLVASNSVGISSSSNSVLTVTNEAPIITLAPQPQTVNAGTSASFTVVANGPEPKSYQWRLNGNPISNANGASYTVVNAQQNVAGNYSVAVSNFDGTTISGDALLTVIDTAPVILSQPVASQTIGSGFSAQFSVTTRGSDLRYYQWQFNGVDIPGATLANYTRSSAQISHSGDYRVVVTNSFGAVTSSISALTVTNSGPVILSQPQSQVSDAGTVAIFSVAAQGASLAYQWRLEGTNLSGATSASYTNFNAQQFNAGNYSVVITNFEGTATSDNALLTVIDRAPTITAQPVANQTVFAGTNPSFSVSTVGSDPRNYQWRFNGADIPGATLAAYTRNNAQAGHSGNYTVVITNLFGAVTSAVSQLTVIPPPPSIVQQPQGRVAPAGSNVTFTVVANSQIPVTYQWKFNSVNISGATDSSFTRLNAQTTHSGNYSVVISNTSGFVASDNAFLSVTNSKPIIVQQPVARYVVAGNSATFSVEAIGSDPRSYQWRFNNNNIKGATNSSFTIFDAQSANQGNYSVVITNAFGLVTSGNAGLTVTESAPVLYSQPVSRRVMAGACVTFSVNVSGSKPMKCQWTFNNAPIPGAYDTSLTIYDIQPEHAGTFAVSLTNAFGNLTSATATLTVVTNPIIDTVSFVNSSNQMIIWSAIPDRVYRLQYKDSLTAANWINLGADIAASDCVGFKVDTNAPGTQRFYRLILMP